MKIPYDPKFNKYQYSPEIEKKRIIKKGTFLYDKYFLSPLHIEKENEFSIFIESIINFSLDLKRLKNSQI